MMFPYGSRRLADPLDPGPMPSGEQGRHEPPAHIAGCSDNPNVHSRLLMFRFCWYMAGAASDMTSDLASAPTAPERDRDVALDWGL